MSKAVKIALVGYSRAGKDEVGKLICRHSAGHVRRLAFGDALKTGLFNLFPDLPREPKPRREMELFGEAMRQIDPDVWIKQLVRQLGIYESYDRDLGFTQSSYIITDLRQPNEYVWARENGFTIVKVESKLELRRQRAAGDKEFQEVNHSERFIHTFEQDCLIQNSWTIDELRTQVIWMLNKMGVETI